MSNSPPWLREAKQHLGTSELPGPPSNETINNFFHDAGFKDIRDDSIPWCAAFVGAMLQRSGYTPSLSLLARSYMPWGSALDAPIKGAIAIFPRGSNPAEGHVGFISGINSQTLEILGGNQNNQVCLQNWEKDKALGFRWPHLGKATFKEALSTLLQREGGWSNHNADPGGPTNQGITLNTYKAAIFCGVISSPYKNPEAGLRHITKQQIETIYLQQYWYPSCCHLMPATVAGFHFDAAVNQGVNRAIKFLQQVAMAEIDGEVGPETISKVWAQSPKTLTEQYKERRLEHYRSLKTYSIFGKGWRNRLDEASAAASQLKPIPNTQHQIEEKDPMSTTINDSDKKWWGESLTIWGAIVTALSTLLPLLGPLIGLDISTEMVEQFGETVARLIQLFGGITGTTMTLYGRARASAPLTRRAIDVRI